MTMDRERLFQATKDVSRDSIRGLDGPAGMIRYPDAVHGSNIALLVVKDRPYEGAVSYVTTNLSDVPVGGRVTPPLGAEVIGVCDAGVDVPRLLSEIVFRARERESGPVRHEVMLVVVPAEMSRELRHVLFVDPVYWQYGFEPRIYDYKTVAWLLLVPISESERLFIKKEGAAALEVIFDETDTEISDLLREPVL
jgi:hypothetical protein